MNHSKKRARSFQRPDLVVPYQEQPLRDKLYPYILTTAIVLATIVAVIMASMKGAS